MITVRLENDSYLYCDQEPYKKIHPPFFKKHLPGSKTFLTVQEVDQWFYSVEYKIAKSYLLFLLGRRDYLKKALVEKLSGKEISDKTSTKILQEFERLGYINDRRIVQSLINKYQEKNSLKEIQSILFKKGVDYKQYSDLLSTISKTTQEEAIKKLVAKKKDKDRRKLFSYLYRKGFETALINAVLNEL
jgi:SOS response regulatory protein OraA/RecX